MNIKLTHEIYLTLDKTRQYKLKIAVRSVQITSIAVVECNTAKFENFIQH